MNDRHERVRGNLCEVVSAFINKESNRTSLITVTNVSLSSDLRTATFLISVFPTERETEVLHFLRRKRSECRAYMKERVVMKVIPHLDFAIDAGEKHRQHIDALIQP